MRNDHVALGEEVIAHSDGFIEETTGVAAKVENEAFHVVLIHGLEIFFHFVAGGFVELFELDVADVGLDQEGVGDALAIDLVANDVEDQQFVVPSRATLISTFVPLGPFRRSATLVESRSWVGVLLTNVMTSPGRNPAL